MTGVIGTMAGELAQKRALISDLQEEERDLIHKIVLAAREAYPHEWSDWERGVRSFKAEGVIVPLKRKYNVDKVQAEFGEERPDLIQPEHEVTKVVPASVDGRKLNALWSDAAYARRLEKCVLPQPVEVKLG